MIAFQLVVIALGAIQAWNVRHAFDSDGISYLDIGDAYLRGDWAAAINAYWSPLYSWLLGLAMLVLKPSAYWEFSVVHLVNFVIYLVALSCFNVFLLELIRYNRHVAVASSGNGRVSLPVLAWLGLGYSLFLLSSLEMITLKAVSPDMMVAGLVYLASSILLRIYMGSTRWVIFVLLGVVLGVSYLTKAAMFPLAFIFLGASMFSVGNLRHAIPRVLVALVVFVMIACPFIAALSHVKGRLTVGDTGKLNYAWWVNGVPTYIHWQGEPPGSGTPKHPTRKIFDAPAVYEFGTPIRGTYPPWYDPSYWHEGIVVHFDLKQQLRRLASSAMIYADLIIRFPSSGLIICFLLFCIMGTRLREYAINLAENWIFVGPAVAALIMYSLVHIAWRLVGPFVVLLLAGVASGVRVADSDETKKLLGRASTAMLIIIILSFGISTVQSVTRASVLIGKDMQDHLQWQVAEGLKNIGIRPGHKVAFIGDSYYAYWARLARVQIIAEIPHRSMDKFLSADRTVKSQVFNALATTGAKVVLTNETAIYASTSGWQQIGDTDHYVYVLTSVEGKALRDPAEHYRS
jgi:hypothetical protein